MGWHFSPAMRMTRTVFVMVTRGIFLTLSLVLRAAYGMVCLLADNTKGAGLDGNTTHNNRFWHWHIPPK